MNRIPLLLSALFLVSILGGCVGSDDVRSAEDDLAADADEARVSETTGSLHGTVASDLFEPLGGAQVALIESAQETTVARNGEFTINDIEPGRYTMRVQALGFLPHNRAVEVKAGEVTEVAIKLAPEPSTDPYVETIHIVGEISSSLIWQVELPVVGCVYGPVGIGYDKSCGGFGGGTDFIIPVNITGTVQTAIVEVVWDPAGPLGEHLALDYICPDAPRTSNGAILDTEHPCYYRDPGSTSPLVLRVDKTESAEGGYNWTGDWDARIFANYGMLGTYELTGVDMGVAYQQKFNWYVTRFHREAGPEGYSGIPDQ